MRDPKEIILEVVRGERPLTDLKAVGISLRFRKISGSPSSREIVVSPRDDSSLTVSVTAADLAKGLQSHQGRPEVLKDWGAFVLGGDVIDLDFLESEPQGDVVLGGVWDASFGGRLSEEVAKVVADLAR